MFDEFDIYNQGKITVESLKQVASDLGEDLNLEEIRDMIRGAGGKDDQFHITRKDFIRFLSKP